MSRVPPSTGPEVAATVVAVDSVVAVGVPLDAEQPTTARTANDTARTAVRRERRRKEERGAFKDYDCTRPDLPTEVASPRTHLHQGRSARMSQ